VGAGAAQRIAISLAVLTFVWGAFAIVSAVSGRRAWHLMPVIAMLAYSWVFHMGLFSLYLSLGLCFWVLALAWEWKPWRLAAAAPILALAYLAHTLPVFWTAGLLAYLWLAGRTAPRTLAWLVAVSLPAMVLLRELVDPKFISEWSLQRVFMTSGTNTSWTFDAKYSVVLVGLLLVWGTMFSGVVAPLGNAPRGFEQLLPIVRRRLRGGFRPAGCVGDSGLSPRAGIHLRAHGTGVAVCICGLLGAARPRMLERYALVAVALIFFCFLYRMSALRTRWKTGCKASWRNRLRATV